MPFKLGNTKKRPVPSFNGIEYIEVKQSSNGDCRWDWQCYFLTGNSKTATDGEKILSYYYKAKGWASSSDDAMHIALNAFCGFTDNMRTLTSCFESAVDNREHRGCDADAGYTL